MADTDNTLKENLLNEQPQSDQDDANKPSSDENNVSLGIRILMLLFIMHLTFGSYWVFDTPGAIQKQLTAYLDPGVDPKDSWYSDGKNLWLYSIYSYPNIVLAFFGGYIVDSITGLRLGALLFCGLVMLGQLVFAVGIGVGGTTGYAIMMCGRFIFGLGGESLTVAQNNYTVKYFAGPYVALAFGMVVSYSRVGSSVNFVVTPALANSAGGVPLAVWVGFAFCAMSFVFALCASAVDIWYDKKTAATQAASGEEAEEEPPVRLRDVGKFSAEVWLLYLITLTFYVSILTFYTIASNIMQNIPSISGVLPGTTEDDKAYWATFLLSIPNFVAIPMSPLSGRIVDRCGKSLYLIAFASIMFVVGHLIFLAFANGWIAASLLFIVCVMVWLGIAYSLGAACLWPMLALLVPSNMVATGYGAMTAVQNAGLAIFPQLIGFLTGLDGINGTSWQYTVPIIIFIAVAGMAFCLTMLLLIIDNARTGGRLNMSAMQRKIHEESNKAEITHDGWPVAQKADDEEDVGSQTGSPGPMPIHVNVVRESNISGSLNATSSSSFSKEKRVNSNNLAAPHAGTRRRARTNSMEDPKIVALAHSPTFQN